MRSFTVTLCAFGLAMAATTAFSRTAAAEEQLTLTVRNKYVTREGSLGHDGGVLHTQYVHGTDSGFYAGGWWAMSLSPFAVNKNGADEFRLFMGKRCKSGRLTLDFGAQYEDRYKLLSLKNGDVITLYSEAQVLAHKSDTADFTPFLRLEGHAPIHASQEQLNALAVAGFTFRGRPEKESLMAILFRPAFIYDTGAVRHVGYGMLGSFDLALNWQFGKHVEVNLPELRIFKPIKVHDDRTEQQILGGVLTVSF